MTSEGFCLTDARRDVRHAQCLISGIITSSAFEVENEFYQVPLIRQGISAERERRPEEARDVKRDAAVVYIAVSPVLRSGASQYSRMRYGMRCRSSGTVSYTCKRYRITDSSSRKIARVSVALSTAGGMNASWAGKSVNAVDDLFHLTLNTGGKRR